MKKLLTTAAVCGLAVAVSSPAVANGLTLELGGYMKGYAFYTDQDDDSAAAAGDSREFDIIRETEIHLGAETTLDNGLTVGFHTEAEADGNFDEDFDVQESYAYFSGGWGRVNFGAEDSAAYLLQVAVPSANASLDGLRQDINPVNFDNLQDGAIGGESITAAFDIEGTRGLGYDQNISGYDDKFTYLSPILNGFQVGASYTPDSADISDADAENEDNAEDAFGEVYDLAVRYEGQIDNVGVIVGAGYTHQELEANTAIADGDATDDRTAWNIGVDLDIGPFGVGVTYLEDDYGEEATVAGGATRHDDEETVVVGVDYTTGPFKLGASYMDIENAGAVDGRVVGGTELGIDVQRYSGGVVYTYGPGMTFRGTISHIELENVSDVTGNGDVEATSLVLGTQINF